MREINKIMGTRRKMLQNDENEVDFYLTIGRFMEKFK